jgi:glutaminyl-peptide cyclotransferase
MRGAQAIVLLVAAAACSGQDAPADYARLGERALGYTAQAVAFGPRPAGSEAQARQQQFILERLRRFRCELAEDDFTADTPAGPRRMKNILCDFPGDSGRLIVVGGHYDTLDPSTRPGLGRFVGANDGGSSTGFLLALAELLESQRTRDTIRIAFFDGEESVVSWQGDDHTYGSRRLARQWAADSTATRIRAVVNVDMIGDADLNILYEGNSTPWLRDLVFSVAHRLGYAKQFPRASPAYIEDDHLPFLAAGIPAVDLIDFDYGLLNRHWHTAEDTLDKLDAGSFAVMLHVVRETIAELETRP